MSDQYSDEESMLLGAIPEDGSTMGNRAVISALSWDSDHYRTVRDGLVGRGVLRLGRGYGGSVGRVLSVEPTKSVIEAPPASESKKKELALYPEFLRALELWAKDQGWDDHLVRQTANQGSKKTGGTWTRPDFVVVGYRRFEYTAGIVRDVETFEVKPSDYGVEAVFETASHSRVATKSYLAVEASNTVNVELLDRIESECQRFGIGLIEFAPGKGLDGWVFRVEARRQEPDPADLERFVQDQIDARDQKRIRKWLH